MIFFKSREQKVRRRINLLRLKYEGIKAKYNETVLVQNQLVRLTRSMMDERTSLARILAVTKEEIKILEEEWNDIRKHSN